MLKGSIVAIVTPMFENGDIDWQRLDNLVDFHIENKTNAIVATGTTGEPSTMTFDEHFEVIEKIVKRVNKRIPVLAGTGANNTKEAIKLAKHAQEVGADYSLSVTPYYNKPTQEGLYQHFKTIAEATTLPIVLYNVPGRTGVDMLNDTVLRLAEVDGIIALKDATGDVERGIALIKSLKELKGRTSKDFVVVSGDDATASELILNGARGNISVTANVAPFLMQQMCKYALDGDRENAEKINEQLSYLNKALFVEPNPIPVKWALNKMGMISRGIRLPLTLLAQEKQDEVFQALKKSKVL